MSDVPEPVSSAEWSREEFLEYCHVKRFMERWRGDNTFREKLPLAPAACAAEYGLEVDADALRPLWDLELMTKLHMGEIEVSALPRAVRNFHLYRGNLHRGRPERVATRAPTEPRWRAWRNRQMARAESELGTVWAKSIIFSTAAYELSRGCSVGCWFCGVAAPRLTDHFRYTPENARLFRGVLELMMGLCGPEALRSQFLYWATDPLDNPDYEVFCHEFRHVVGRYPLLTTALALRDIERTRSLLEVLKEDPGLHHFSILNKKLLDRVHAAFSPEELSHVNCLTHSDESVVVKSNAGRFRERGLRNPDLLVREQKKLQLSKDHLALAEAHGEYFGPATIACVSGFLFNLLERRVKLVSPCKASTQWPLGYVVHCEASFQDSEELATLLDQMIEEHMPVELPRGLPMRFRSDLSYERSNKGIHLWTTSSGFQYGNREQADFVGELGDLIAEGRSTPTQAAGRMLERHGVFPAETYRILGGMFEKGLLSSDPRLSCEQTGRGVELGQISGGDDAQPVEMDALSS